MGAKAPGDAARGPRVGPKVHRRATRLFRPVAKKSRLRRRRQGRRGVDPGEPGQHVADAQRPVAAAERREARDGVHARACLRRLRAEPRRVCPV